jgi:hypothetical protein
MDNRNTTQQPDKWVVVEINNIVASETLYKVFGSWGGGYVDGDRWKINSGITSVHHDDDYYYFMGYSGSCYKCHRRGYGVMTSYSQSVLDNLIDKASSVGANIDVLPDNTNFMKLLNQNKDE